VEVIRQNYGEIALEVQDWLQRTKQMSLPVIDDPYGTESTPPPEPTMPASGFIEIIAAMYDQEENTRSGVDIASFRRKLWDEHLQQYDAALGAMPEGERLALWNQVAAQNVSLVNASPPSMQGKALP
jgi:hypothetical protein